MRQTGFIHVYTGDGKGKTTAALGLALRAAGHGFHVFIGQFMKGQYYGELASLRQVPGIVVEQFGDEGCCRKEEMTSEHREKVLQGLETIKKVFKDKSVSLVIMDEICVAVWFELATIAEVIDVIKRKPEHVELVLTGRRAPDEFLDLADLVTEMKEVKHYYTRGILARDGIER